MILVSDDFDRLIDTADEVEDRREFAAARADDDYVPWDEVTAPPPHQGAGDGNAKAV